MKLRHLLLLAVVALLIVPVAQASVQFSHPYDENSTNAFSSFAYPGEGPTHQSFADYYWDGSFTITDFHWWGVPDVPEVPVEGFWFQIYDQAVGSQLPGSIGSVRCQAGRGFVVVD